MRAPLVQRNIKQLAETLTSLYAKIATLRAERKKFNEAADKHFWAAQINDDYGDFEGAEEAQQYANAYLAQATLFTPEINKLAKKIKNLEEVQKALKHELGCAQCYEDYSEIEFESAGYLEQSLTQLSVTLPDELPTVMCGRVE